ncbi:unnamed protein product [Allacma fusca]|uniref:CUB domain-containing protein n=1 Tax=Allacma fusca TaxID=39272 RepID=A0A8J2KPJ7_9HEXA|nr:unnamed protein product [Allacma fusca]
MMKKGVLLAVFLVNVVLIQSKVLGDKIQQVSFIGENKNTSIRPLSKILGNEICGDDSFTGICLDANECDVRGGSSNGQCWNNDICCKITAHCLSNSNPCVIRHSGTVVVNENGTSDYRRAYRYVKAENICQLRLDFDEFELTQPEFNGDCNNDLMQVISSRAGFGICGSNSHQHIYLNYDSRSYIDISMRIRSVDAKYRIRSTFIECNSEMLAPVNCLQYFYDLDGSVKSLNAGQQQLNNLDYSICVASYEGVSRIRWKSCQDNPFFISGSGVGPLESPGCNRDWVQIYGFDRYCGNGFNTVTITAPSDPSQCNGQPITDPYTGGTFVCAVDGTDPPTCTCIFFPPTTVPPFDPTRDIDASNTGFCLEYEQLW